MTLRWTEQISEKTFQEQVRRIAEVFGWKVYFTWRSIHSPAGFPDLVLVRPPRLIFAELKSENGTLTDAQDEWIQKLVACAGLNRGMDVYLWRPRDIAEVERILR